MDKIIEGVREFNAAPHCDVKALLGRLAHGDQRPQALVVTCADSRIQPEFITRSDPGDIFMVRNVGNLVPRPEEAWETGNHSIGAALEFGLENLGITDIIVMGHSSCGAMRALLKPNFLSTEGHLSGWLRNARMALARYGAGLLADEPGLTPEDRLSQINVMAQMDHIKDYLCVRRRLEKGEVEIHGWYFDMVEARILAYNPPSGRFLPMEETYAAPETVALR